MQVEAGLTIQTKTPGGTDRWDKFSVVLEQADLEETVTFLGLDIASLSTSDKFVILRSRAYEYVYLDAATHPHLDAATKAEAKDEAFQHRQHLQAVIDRVTGESDKD